MCVEARIKMHRGNSSQDAAKHCKTLQPAATHLLSMMQMRKENSSQDTATQ